MIGFTGNTSVASLPADEEYWFDEMHTMTLQEPDTLFNIHLASADLSEMNTTGEIRIRKLAEQSNILVELIFPSGHHINCGSDQLFLDNDNKFVKASDIVPGQLLRGYRQLSPVMVRMVGKSYFKKPTSLYIPEAVNDSSAFLLEAGVYAGLFKKD